MTQSDKPTNGIPADLESKLWQAADKLRGHLDAAEYKNVVLGLIFLKYISDAFQALYERLQATEYADPEDRDEYLGENIFFVPEEARWSLLQNNAKQPNIGILIDRAMAAIERDNPSLKGVLPQDYGREDLDKRRLGELIDLIGTIALGDDASRSQDVLGRVYEYFLGQFATAEGKKGGQFYTPRPVVRLLVEMLEPYHGRVYDPCCGSGGMFVQSEKFIEAHGGNIDQHLGLRAGEQPDDLAAGQDEPGHSRHRRQPRRVCRRHASTTTCTPTCAPTSSSPIRRST